MAAGRRSILHRGDTPSTRRQVIIHKPQQQECTSTAERSHLHKPTLSFPRALREYTGLSHANSACAPEAPWVATTTPASLRSSGLLLPACCCCVRWCRGCSRGSHGMLSVPAAAPACPSSCRCTDCDSGDNGGAVAGWDAGSRCRRPPRLLATALDAAWAAFIASTAVTISLHGARKIWQRAHTHTHNQPSTLLLYSAANVALCRTYIWELHCQGCIREKGDKVLHERRDAAQARQRVRNRAEHVPPAQPPHHRHS